MKEEIVTECDLCKGHGIVEKTVTKTIKHEPYINIKPFEV